MKQFLAFLVFALGVACNSPKTGRSANTNLSVADVRGSAEVRRQGTWERIQAGHFLSQGDGIRTGADSQVDLQFAPHGGVLTVMPNSAIDIDQLGSSGTNQTAVATIRLSSGRVVGDTLKLPKGSKVMIKTNAGTFGIP